MKSTITRFILSIFLVAICSLPVLSQTATSVRVVKDTPDALLGDVVVTINGTQRTIARDVWNAWIIERGRAVVYSGTDGAGGYEDEGQSLWRYDVASGRRRKLVSEHFAIVKVVEARTRTGRNALLVTMADGGLGAPHVSVVDPIRGQVWRHRIARFVGVRNGRIAVATYRPTDFENLKAYRSILYLDLDSLLRRRASPNWPVGVPRN